MSFLTPVLNFLSPGSSRSIADITGYITINENTVDALEITQHPVQQGATISDHAFQKPTSITMQIQFAKKGILGSLLGTQNDPIDVTYKKLLDLQAMRYPFTIATPKRRYENMLLQTLGTTTDKSTENVLSISASFLQVVIVNVATTLVPKAKLQQPKRSLGTAQSGKKSALLTGVSGVFSNITGFTQ